MNKLFIIGNLTRDPELRQVNGREGPVNVCDFTVAVNRRQRNAQGQNEADFFRVTVWRGLADTCKQYLAKGRKVAVTGPVACRVYTGNDGVTRASMEVQAEDVEFLTPRQDGQQTYQGGAPADQSAQPQYQGAPAQQQYQPQQQVDPRSGYPIIDDEDLPF